MKINSCVLHLKRVNLTGPGGDIWQNQKNQLESKKNLQTAPQVSVSGAAPYQPKMSTADMRSAVKTQIGQRIKLADYRSTIVPLTSAERELVIDQAMKMLDQVYAHLPLW